MPDLAFWELVALGPTAAIIGAVLAGARLWRSQEKRILMGASFVAFVVIALSTLAIAGAFAHPAQLTVRNESPRPIEVSGVNIDHQVLEPGATEEFYEDSGPGWIAGFIDDIEIIGGPEGTTRVLFSNMDPGKTVEIDVTDNTVTTGGSR